MSEEIKNILEEMRFKAGIYRDHKKRGLSFNSEEKNCALLLEYIQQKENIIKEVREKLNTQLAFTSSYQLNYQSAMYIIEEAKSILDKGVN